MIRFLPTTQRLLFFYVIFILSACQSKQDTLFTRLSIDDSGILFENTVVESDSINIMQYEYTYNGGGVATGDFNNDGWCDLYFTGNTVSNRLYLNQGDLTFNDITGYAGV